MNWLILILSLPTENSSARMRAWRALKASGAAVLRDGVYVLPDQTGLRTTLEAIASEVLSAGGQTQVLSANTLPPHTDDEMAALFDRSADYAALAQEIDALQRMLTQTPTQDSAKQIKKLTKSLTTLIDMDFFPGEAQPQTRARLAALQRAYTLLGSPDEPETDIRTPPLCDRQAYQGRTWATRKRPWVDRLASAWLIQRHIDPQARFLWLNTPANFATECPADALGFDFDGATFTHTESNGLTRVSFETLLYSFGLTNDSALARLAALVHCLDVGGLPVPEAAGVETVLAGMRRRITDDDALLAAAAEIFDDLYTQFGDPKSE